MTSDDIVRLRLQNQKIIGTKLTTPAEVVTWMGGMQGQDYLGSLWAIALRIKQCTEKDVEQAIADRTIVRTWPMRRTLHWVSARDVHWMLDILGPRVIAGSLGRYRQLGLTDTILAQCRKIITKALTGGKRLHRNQINDLLGAAGISLSGRLHIIWRLGQEGLLCFGPREGKQQTIVLLDEWIPKKHMLPRAEAIGELATRYFTSHGPATMHDFAWWSGLTLTEVKSTLASLKSKLSSVTLDGKTYWMGHTSGSTPRAHWAHLLPPFDEYIVSYKDRTAQLKTEHNNLVNHGGNGIFQPVIVVDGKVVGTWKRDIQKRTVAVSVHPFGKFTPDERKLIEAESKRYKKFLAL